MTKENSIKVSPESHRWLSEQSDATQITIKSIVDLAIQSLRGKPKTQLMGLFCDKKGVRNERKPVNFNSKNA